MGWGCINSIYQKLLSLDQMLPHCSYSDISAYFSPRILAGPPGTRHRGEGHSPVAAEGRRRRSQTWMRAVSVSPLPSLLLEGSTSSLRGGQGGWEGARFAQRALGSPDSSGGGGGELGRSQASGGRGTRPSGPQTQGECSHRALFIVLPGSLPRSSPLPGPCRRPNHGETWLPVPAPHRGGGRAERTDAKS